MKTLDDWMARQFAEHTVEPNSGLGQAISYMQNHWQKLTLFLRVPGVAGGEKPRKAGGSNALFAWQ